jgi:2-C-methyl-D-erythritol 4-phosphate cytidylyltransferase
LGGVPLVVHAVLGLLESGSVDHVLVAVREEDVNEAPALFAGAPSAAGVRLGRIEVVAGAANRLGSVAAALWHGIRRFPAAHTVLVHDATRALTPPSLVSRLVEAVAEGADAVVPVLPMADTVKAVDATGAVLGTPDRSELRVVQAPQAFRTELLCRACRSAGYGPRAARTPTGLGATGLGAAGLDATGLGAASLVERLGERVHTVPGDPLAFAVSTPWQLRVAETMVAGVIR